MITNPPWVNTLLTENWRELSQAVEPDLLPLTVTSGKRKDTPLDPMAVVSARTFSVDETRRYAGGLDDPARMASGFAGVAVSSLPQNNAIAIRGNAPRTVQWRLEGVEIPNPSHFAGGNIAGGGFVTIFSSQLLADSDFLTGAFPASYGNALGGIFDVRLRSGNSERREYAFPPPRAKYRSRSARTWGHFSMSS